MDKFTIVTPSLNQGKFLEQTILSVITQKGDFYIDYIIADGGSIDNSVEIIKKYDKLLKQKQFKINCKGIDFRWWSKKDKGQTNAINNAFKIAKGDILTWINSDDFLEQRALNIVFREFKTDNHLKFVYGDINVVDDKNRLLRQDKLRFFSYEELLREGNLIHQPASFFKKELLDKYGFLNENLFYVMDYGFLLRILKKEKYKYINDVLANFRDWKSSKTHGKPMRMMNEMEQVRRKYGGKFFDPSNIHRLRHKIPGNIYIKKNFLPLFKFIKFIIYKFTKNKSIFI